MAGADLFGRFVPPEHDEVGGVGHVGIDGAQGFRVAVTEGFAHAGGAEERRIAHDEIGRRPFGGAGFVIAHDGNRGGVVGHVFAGDGMFLFRASIPAGDGCALIIEDRRDGVPRKDGVAAFDVVEGFDDGFGRRDASVRAEMPLEVADPEDEFGDGGGAGIDFEAEELVRIDGEAGEVKGGGGFDPHTLEGVEDFGFEAFEVVEGHVEEIAGAAGGVEDAEFAQAAMESADDIGGFGGFFLTFQREGGGFHGVPLGAEGFDDDGEDEAFDVGARGVVGAELVAFVRIKRALQQGAEDGGLDVAPIGPRGFDEERQLIVVEREGGGVVEEGAVEAEDLFAQDGGEAAGLHAAPEFFDHGTELLGVSAQAFEQAGEAVLGQQLDILGKHGEERAHEEGGDTGGVVSAAFQRLREASEVLRDLAGDAGAAARGIERERIEPREAQQVADGGIGEAFERDAVTAGIGERHVSAAGAGELGINLDGVADVDDEEQRRTSLAGGQGAGVLFGLPESAEHGFVPRGGATGGGAALEGFAAVGGLGAERGFVGGGNVGTLLAFGDKADAAVAVDAAGAGGAVGMTEGHGALEDVGVVGVVGACGIGTRDFQHVAKLGEEQLEIGALGGAGMAPALDECGHGVGHSCFFRRHSPGSEVRGMIMTR